MQLSCEEFPEWIVPCSSDPPTVDDEGLDTWFKIGKVCMYMCCIHACIITYINFVYSMISSYAHSCITCTFLINLSMPFTYTIVCW